LTLNQFKSFSSLANCLSVLFTDLLMTPSY